MHIRGRVNGYGLGFQRIIGHRKRSLIEAVPPFLMTIADTAEEQTSLPGGGQFDPNLSQTAPADEMQYGARYLASTRPEFKIGPGIGHMLTFSACEHRHLRTNDHRRPVAMFDRIEQKLSIRSLKRGPKPTHLVDIARHPD